MPLIVVLGAGTSVGKTWVSVALIEELVARGARVLGLKPIETGVADNDSSSDARALERAAGGHRIPRHSLHAFRRGVSPHLAARLANEELTIENIAAWVREQVALHIGSLAQAWVVVEMAGGVFTPLSTTATNFELARALDPAIWVLVGSDTLGVLHDLTAATEAMRARGRSADFTVLSEARPSDASTGTNANELTLLGIASPVYTLARNDKHGIRALIHAILAGN